MHVRLAAAAIFKSCANRALEKNTIKKANALKVFFIELPFIMIGVGDYTYLYLKNLYFKSLRWFCRRIPLIHDLINIFTLKPSIFDKKLNLLEK
ncbi:hypothetical protein VN1251_04430 [Helicobacter pylori]|nr:hypothetical protein VN1251_04430 [Helicobacter pylori]